jgi:hypothetical protein
VSATQGSPGPHVEVSYLWIIMFAFASLLYNNLQGGEMLFEI